MEKYEQGRDEKIYRSVAPTRSSTKTCGTLVLVEKTNSIHSIFWKFMGRLSWKQYIPQKRARFGIKLFQLCESESGYIWNSLIYTGKCTAFNENYNDYGLSTKSVLTLIHELKGKGYCLSTDKFYASLELVELPIDSKTDICGTLRPNRKGLPVSLKSSTLKKGEIIAFQKGEMCVLKWKDKKPLHMISTFHNADMMEVKAKKGDSVKLKPKAVVFYNNSMGGVDKPDLSVYLTILLPEINSENTTRRIFDIC
ncbi:piggyBac transposable element-derived protein 4 [Trichonephila clavipes]|nr:piggyBac transposable element-derived protein 4 [Trichonephila clavipes]